MAMPSGVFRRAARQWFTNLRLPWAAAHGDNEKVRALIAAGANVHTEQDAALLSAVRCACSRLPPRRTAEARLDTVRAILEAGADVHARSDKALRIAVAYGRTDVVKMLLDAGADIHELNDRQVRRLALAYERDAIATALTSPEVAVPKRTFAPPSLGRQ